MSQERASGETPPVFSAVTSSARQLFSLLRCIGFLPKALVQISGDGLRVTVEDLRVMQGHAFLEKRLFNTYDFNPPPPSQHSQPDGTAATSASDHPIEEPPNGSADSEPVLSFNTSLTSLLECLQIFGAEASRENSKWRSSGVPDRSEDNTNANANPEVVFDSSSLKVGGTCRFSYAGEGYPLCLMMEENGILTTCELTTYEPEAVEEIPLARDALAMKIIMKAGWLHDAIQELDGSSVERLILKASPHHPNFSLSATGPLGSTVVEFTYDATRTSDTLDTFIVPEAILFSYKFSLLKNAMRTMSIASKVSIRGDKQGVLSLQFMIEHEGGSPSFIDFRFLPFACDDRDSEED